MPRIPDDDTHDTQPMRPIDEPPPLVIPRGQARATLLAAYANFGKASLDLMAVAEACARALDAGSP
jgi:hypothetical protein